MRRWLSVACAGLCLTVAACTTPGDFDILGYSTKPNYDPRYRTVYVPIFKNRTFRQGLEFELTRAVVDEINRSTPMRVVDNCEQADTELLGTISVANKLLLTRNQFNEIREGETVVAVELVWRDLKTGEILSQPARRPRLSDTPVAGPPPTATPGWTPGMVPGQPMPIGATPTSPLVTPDGNTFQPETPVMPLQPGGVVDPLPPPPPPPIPPVVVVQSLGTFVPELGESITTSFQENVRRLAVQIVSMMEKPW